MCCCSLSFPFFIAGFILFKLFCCNLSVHKGLARFDASSLCAEDMPTPVLCMVLQGEVRNAGTGKELQSTVGMRVYIFYINFRDTCCNIISMCD